MSKLQHHDEQPLDVDELEIKLHDAALSDHLSVGVQTWGSSILMGKVVAGRPDDYFGCPDEEVAMEEEEGEEEEGKAEEAEMKDAKAVENTYGPNVLELGAGTGLLSILSRKILDRIQDQKAINSSTRDRRRSTDGCKKGKGWGKVVATDFHPLVLENLKICVNLNFEADDEKEKKRGGIDILPLDWSTFPAQAATSSLNDVRPKTDEDDDVHLALRNPFDLIFVSDCVYDTTHAGMIRDCVEWTLKTPVIGDDGVVLKGGGVVVS
jgi:SAM-dependent methyltransferase